MSRYLGVLVIVLGLAAACAGQNPVGAACSTNAQCQGIKNGYCPKAGVCTAACESHADCGCAAGTKSRDLAMGSCDAACIDLGDGSPVCLRVCKNNSDCAAGTTCRSPGKDAGFSICL